MHGNNKNNARNGYMNADYYCCALGPDLDSMTLICSQSKKRKLLKWFEEVFVRVAGEDQPIQVDQLATAIHTDHVSS